MSVKLKNLIICAVLAAIISKPVFAVTSTEVEELCSIQQDLAFAIMSNRQSGASVTRILKTTDTIKSDNFKQFIRGLVYIAYEEPLHYSEKAKVESANRFAIAVYKSCKRKYR